MIRNKKVSTGMLTRESTKDPEQIDCRFSKQKCQYLFKGELIYARS